MEFKYTGVLFTSRGRVERETDRHMGPVSATMDQYSTCITAKKELSHKTQLSIYQLIYVPNLTHGYKLWVMTKRMRLWIQVAEMSFLQRVAELSLRDKRRGQVPAPKYL